MSPLSALTLVKLGVVSLGVLNLALLLRGPTPPRSPSITEPRRVHVHAHVENRPDPDLDFDILHLDTPTPARTRTLLTEETTHYPVNGTLADLEWASLVPSGNHGLVLLGPDSDVRPYAVTMFHALHCLDRIRKAIVEPPVGGREGDGEDDWRHRRARHHVHHCFNYLRQMVLCAANTRLNPTNHVHQSGKLASDGIGLAYQCRDWDAVYKAFEANYALNRTMTFAR